MVIKKGNELLWVVTKVTQPLETTSIAREGVVVGDHHVVRDSGGQSSSNLLGHWPLWEWR